MRDDDEEMTAKHEPAEPKKIHGDKLAALFRPAAQREEDENGADSDVRLLPRHPAAKNTHVVRR